MRRSILRQACFLSLGCLVATPAISAEAPKAPKMDTILYGAAYYNEYLPAQIANGRLDKDISLMKAAGITVVRMGESSWAKWEPEEGRFDFAWMDTIVDAMGKAGIKVILGTPTYSIPVWMYARHPEMLARPMGGGQTGYGMRQNMNIDDVNYRRYAERIIVALADHYRNNPTVIGWQLDNETSAYGSTNPSVQTDFVEWLKARYGTVGKLNDAWLLSYWGQNVDSWAHMPSRDKATSPSYKLDWSRFQQWRATRFIGWQAGLVRRHARADQFLTQNHAGIGGGDVNPIEMDAPLNVVGNDIYFDWQDKYDGWSNTFQGDLARSVKHQNYFVVETNAQSIGWDATRQIPPYDGQMYQNVFTDISNGANLISYWHWATLHGGQETYWNGVLGHDLEPNRAYREVSKAGNDLKRVGKRLVDLKRTNQVAILYSIDSNSALSFMPYRKPVEGLFGPRESSYSRPVEQLHAALYQANVGTDIVFSDAADFSQYKLIIVPALYIADDKLLNKINEYVRQGGHAIITFRSGFANEHSLVRWEKGPGPLSLSAGVQYQEVSTLTEPLALKDDPFKAGKGNKAEAIAELLQPTTAKPIAWYDHSFYGKWPAVTVNRYGKGSVLYEGTQVSDAVQQSIIYDELKKVGLYGSDQQLPPNVRIKHATSKFGTKLHFYFNYSPKPINVTYLYGGSNEVLKDHKLTKGDIITLDPWGVAIAEETLQ